MLMNDPPRTILVIDDEPGIHKTLNLLLQSDFSVQSAVSGEEGLRKVDAVSPDLILLDLIMPRMSGIEVLKRLMQSSGDIPVIIFTAHGSIDSAVRAIRMGAADYIEKPFDRLRLEQAIRECLKRKNGSEELSIRHNIVGKSPQIQRVWQMVEKYGVTDLPILLQGETGTGKELFARAIHEISKRRDEAFVPVDCSAIPETLFESEIFGYERGAFTGAVISKPGQLNWADKGTFFLDEISNLPLSYQSKLLRVIQDRHYVPLGAKTTMAVDVRFISSSNTHLREAVERRNFREDLYYRVSGVCIELPPLREREGDVELLVRYFVDKYAKRYGKQGLKISGEAMELLLSYSWPGNVRELEYMIGAAVVSADRVVLPDHFSASLRRGTIIPKGGSDGKIEFEMNFSCDLTQPIDLKRFGNKVAREAERFIVAEVQRRFSLNKTDLAKFLNIDPKTLRTKVKGQV